MNSSNSELYLSWYSVSPLSLILANEIKDDTINSGGVKTTAIYIIHTMLTVADPILKIPIAGSIAA